MSGSPEFEGNQSNQVQEQSAFENPLESVVRELRTIIADLVLNNEPNEAKTRPLWQRLLLWQIPLWIVGFLIVLCYNPRITACEGQTASYKNKTYCLKTPQDSLTYYENIFCDAVASGDDKSYIETFKYMPKAQLDSLTAMLEKNGFDSHQTPEQVMLHVIFPLIRVHKLDSASFYRNAATAYWNGAIKHLNNKNIDSTCIYFEKLYDWAWKDSILSKNDEELMDKICSDNAYESGQNQTNVASNYQNNSINIVVPNKKQIENKLNVLEQGKSERYVFDCQQTNKKVVLARKEGDYASKDRDINALYDNAAIFLDYFKTQLGWRSFDNKGGNIIINAHYMRSYNNTFWDGKEYFVGGGDGGNFTAFAYCLEIMVHELSHGIIQNTANFDYYGQTGALSEHFADVMGIAARQWHLKQTATTSDWLIGKDVVTGSFKGKGIRSLKNPDDASMVLAAQPTHMSNYNNENIDNGGVHINSGIVNKAFYLVSMDIGTQEAMLLWFEALKTLNRKSQFIDLYNALKMNAAKLIKQGRTLAPNTLTSIDNAFATVGIIEKNNNTNTNR